MRVALLNPGYWPEVRRGSERMVHDLAAGLAARGASAWIVTSHPGRPSLRTEDGFRVIRNWRPPARPFLRAGYPPNTSHAPLSWAALQALRPDVAHAFFPTDAAAASSWGRRRTRPSVFTIMGVPRHRALRSTPRFLEMWRRAVDASDVVAVLSRGAADAAKAELGVNARVLYPGVDLADWRNCAERTAEPSILCAGSAGDPRKRVDLLLDAFRLVRRQRPTATLLVDRPADLALAERLRDRGGPGVELVDPLEDPSAFRRLYSRAWVSALASEAEAFGLVLVEALACGTPVVGPDDYGPGEIIDDPAVGRTFPGAEPSSEQVARALLEALELATDARTPAACRSRAEDFSSDRMVDAHLELYRELSARTSSMSSNERGLSRRRTPRP